MATGHSYIGQVMSMPTEVISLDKNTPEIILPEPPLSELHKSSGALINGNLPIYCGGFFMGSNGNEETASCYIAGQSSSKPFAILNQARGSHASISFGHSLWILGMQLLIKLSFSNTNVYGL